MSELLVEKSLGRVRILTLNRPETLNALNPELMRLLRTAVRRAARDDTVGCIILTGTAPGFCSGGDVRAISSAADTLTSGTTTARQTTESRTLWLRRSVEAADMLHTMPKPTIAMINGACAGAGLSLAAACDFRFAAASAKFRPAFTSNGMPGDYGGSWLWTHILGTAKARQLYMIDERRNAEEALKFGLIDRIYEDDVLEAETFALAEKLASLPATGLAYAKANLNAALTESFSASLDRESLNMMLARNALVEARRAKA